MKTSLLTLALFLFVGLQLVVGAPPDSIGVGHRVAARWTDGRYYLGTVTAVEGDAFKILYEDGDKLTVKAEHVHPIHANAVFKVGDHVMAGWKGALMYPGTVTEVTATGCRVQWDDGDKPLLVEKNRIVHWRK
ncbi:MAG TPA: hypothetical protein VGO11_02170 [Chthoniobacteraceae bacterium]|nr:hypothetical protein [Chthoniobacteraceae bacterium]